MLNVSSSEFRTITRVAKLECKNRYPIYDHNGGKMAIIDTLFMTKTAEKPYPLGPHSPYKGVPLPPGVNSRYSADRQDRHLVSAIARVRNSGLRLK